MLGRLASASQADRRALFHHSRAAPRQRFKDFIFLVCGGRSLPARVAVDDLTTYAHRVIVRELFIKWKLRRTLADPFCGVVVGGNQQAVAVKQTEAVGQRHKSRSPQSGSARLDEYEDGDGSELDPGAGY